MRAYITLEVDAEQLADDLSELPHDNLIQIVKWIDTIRADVDFTFDLIDMLAESLSDDGFVVTISTTEESK